MMVDTQKLVAPGRFDSNSNIVVCETHESMMKNLLKEEKSTLLMISHSKNWLSAF